MAAQAGARAGVAADLAGAHAGDDLAGAPPRVLQQLLELVLLDQVAVVEAVAGEVLGLARGDDAARAPRGGAAQRVVEAADRRRAPVLGDRQQVERQLQLRLLLELLPRGDRAGELVVDDEGAAVGGAVDAVDRPVQAPAVEVERRPLGVGLGAEPGLQQPRREPPVSRSASSARKRASSRPTRRTIARSAGSRRSRARRPARPAAPARAPSRRRARRAAAAGPRSGARCRGGRGRRA